MQQPQPLISPIQLKSNILIFFSYNSAHTPSRTNSKASQMQSLHMEQKLVSLKLSSRQSIIDHVKAQNLTPDQIQSTLGEELYRAFNRAMLGNCSILNIIKIMISLGMDISVKATESDHIE